MSRYFSPEDFFKDGEVCITEQGNKNLLTLCEVVMNTHYSYASPVDKEDLKSVGVLKALELLHNGDFDATRSSLKNYLYTGMRNEMKNYLYKNGKDVVVDDEILLGINEDKHSSIEDNMDLTDIPDSFIMSAVGRFIDGKETLNKIKSTLKFMGFGIDFRGELKMHWEVEKEVCLVIWKRLKS